MQSFPKPTEGFPTTALIGSPQYTVYLEVQQSLDPQNSIEILLREAEKYVARPYAPYSGFRVVSIARSSSGKLYPGVNVENSSYGLTVCAERVALFNMVVNGDRELEELLVYFIDSPEPQPPCGACLQVMSEFSRNRDPVVHMCSRVSGKCVSRRLSEFLPYRFTLYNK